MQAKDVVPAQNVCGVACGAESVVPSQYEVMVTCMVGFVKVVKINIKASLQTFTFFRSGKGFSKITAQDEKDSVGEHEGRGAAPVVRIEPFKADVVLRVVHDGVGCTLSVPHDLGFESIVFHKGLERLGSDVPRVLCVHEVAQILEGLFWVI